MSAPTVLYVCGPRTLSPLLYGDKVEAVLRGLGLDRVCLVTGCASGADQIAELAARQVWTPAQLDVIPYPLTDEDWARGGLKAGHERNRRAIDETQPDYWCSFTTEGAEQRGTTGAIAYLLSKRVPGVIAYCDSGRFAYPLRGLPR